METVNPIGGCCIDSGEEVLAKTIRDTGEGAEEEEMDVGNV